MSFQNQQAEAYRYMMANINKAQAEILAARRRAAESRMKDMQENVSQDTQIFGKFAVNGIGESRKQVMFPVAFSNPPAILTTIEFQSIDSSLDTIRYIEYGGDAARNQNRFQTQSLDGEHPVVTAVVVDWITEGQGMIHTMEYRPDRERTKAPESRYVGVEILTIADGLHGAKFIVHWSASGIAYSNPAAGPMSDNYAEKMLMAQLGYGEGMA